MSSPAADYLRHILEEVDYLVRRSEGLTHDPRAPGPGGVTSGAGAVAASPEKGGTSDRGGRSVI